MDDHGKRVYLEEILNQSEMSIRAARTVEQALSLVRGNSHEPGARAHYHAEVFRAIHSLLTHLSNVSKLIWPPASGKKCCCKKKPEHINVCKSCFTTQRSSIIIKLLCIEVEDHSLKNRGLRNHLEHFDERLDEWFQNSKRRNIVQDYIGPKGRLVKGIDNSDHMREYDPDTGDFGFRGECYSLIALVKGAEDIIARAKKSLVALEIDR